MVVSVTFINSCSEQISIPSYDELYSISKSKIIKGLIPIEEQERQTKAKDLKEQKEKEKIEKEKVDSLLKKWAKSGPPIEFLSSKFQTISGAVLSGELCTVVEFLDNIRRNLI